MTTTETPGSLSCPPRFFTPRNPDRPTLGGAVAEVARRLGTPLMPWQQYVADVALELDGDKFAYDEVDITVPRQSGKTTLIKAKTVWRLVALARDDAYGPQRSAYYAQTRLAARKKLEQDFARDLRRAKSFTEVPHSRATPRKATEWKLSLNNGNEHIHFGTDSYWQIDAPSRTGGHGDTLDDGTIDEAFAHQDNEVEGSMEPAMLTRRNAQIWVISTAGDAQSFYLWRKVLAGRQAFESGMHGRTASFEWSADDDEDPSNPETWISCSPALGETFGIEKLEALWEKAKRGGQEGIDKFRRAYLNQWPEIPILGDADRERVIDMAAWRDCEDPSSSIAGGLSFGFAVAIDRKSAAIGVAGPRSDGRTHIEVSGTGSGPTPLDHRPGTDWLVPRLRELKAAWPKARFVCDGGNGPTADQRKEAKKAGIDVYEATLADYVVACSQFHDDVIEGRVRHVGQAPLTSAVDGADKRIVNDAWLWSRKNSTVDISPLEAVTFAKWHAENVKSTGPLVAWR